jgi:hypothetical protein
LWPERHSRSFAAVGRQCGGQARRAAVPLRTTLRKLRNDHGQTAAIPVTATIAKFFFF